MADSVVGVFGGKSYDNIRVKGRCPLWGVGQRPANLCPKQATVRLRLCDESRTIAQRAKDEKLSLFFPVSVTA